MPDYYRALPFANGLPSWEPSDAAWHGGPEPWPAPRPPATSEQLDTAGHVSPASQSTLHRLRRLFAIDPEPHNSFGF